MLKGAYCRLSLPCATRHVPQVMTLRERVQSTDAMVVQVIFTHVHERVSSTDASERLLRMLSTNVSAFIALQNVGVGRMSPGDAITETADRIAAPAAPGQRFISQKRINLC
jgi:hypothetical protein